jgi:hypothetical protein
MVVLGLALLQLYMMEKYLNDTLTTEQVPKKLKSIF